MSDNEDLGMSEAELWKSEQQKFENQPAEIIIENCGRLC